MLIQSLQCKPALTQKMMPTGTVRRLPGLQVNLVGQLIMRSDAFKIGRIFLYVSKFAVLLPALYPSVERISSREH